ncbi:macrolide-binding protein FKBP12 [Pyronema domesticum]|uniref:peptidylprolyl isomerase n=1 Tax=Pyronema omphalodes (strain CBS 100304) TaxID=1076935 RepID=U4KVX7_PYROM|nr:macrolide-binding protein FKBP12 [Pyronema domesticum]CCX05803.1 Similar to FK506-binding protein; acc. no. O42993 [Pyronema omphalodes CBS 100304]
MFRLAPTLRNTTTTLRNNYIKSFSTSSINMGVTKTTISAGDGVNFPKAGDSLTMHYVGTFKDGSKFDSSRDRGSPFATRIGVGQVIKGWDEGIPKMSLGEKATLDITYDFAYGERGFPGAIPPKADLIFEVELLSINGKKAGSA